MTNNYAEVEIFLDEHPLPSEYSGKDTTDNGIIVSEAGLYNIINSENSSSHQMEIKITGKGFQIFTFTFG